MDFYDSWRGMDVRWVWDKKCSMDTPVVLGKMEAPIYGSLRPIRPRVQGKQETDHDKNVYLEYLLPLECYDLIVVLFSAGKDSLGGYLRLRELGVPKEKIELWHHDIDGGNEDFRMDWPVTQHYVKAFAKAEGVRLRTSYREQGFGGELFRLGASHPVKYEDEGEIKTCKLSAGQMQSEELKKKYSLKGAKTVYRKLKKLGFRYKFPAKSADLKVRWCSCKLKIDVASQVLSAIDKSRILEKRDHCSAKMETILDDAVLTKMGAVPENVKILIVSGERRGESSSRSKYNEIEKHRTNKIDRAHRLVHCWRNVIDYTERDVWEIIHRNGIRPHPCYIAGWNRCSCSKCIFSSPSHWAGIQELFPEEFKQLIWIEDNLGHTIDNNKSLREYVGTAKSCVNWSNPRAVKQLKEGWYDVKDIYLDSSQWNYPAGAFRGSEGGPC